MTRRSMAVWSLVIAAAGVDPAAAEPPRKQEIEVRTTSLTRAQTALKNLPNGAELQVRGLRLQHTSDLTKSLDAMIGTVQSKPGAEVRLQGRVDSRPFEAKIEGKEVRLRGLVLSQADFDALKNQLRNAQGIREFRFRGMVDNKSIEARFGNDHSRARARTEIRDDHRGSGRDRDGRVTARVTRDQRPERSDRIDRPDRVERTDRTERVERVERTDRTERAD